MKNIEKYKTDNERIKAFRKECDSHGSNCSKCRLRDVRKGNVGSLVPCAFAWLELEAEEEKPLPCPFCGGECEVGLGRVFCKTQSCYCSKSFDMNEKAIAAHNRLVRAVMVAKERDAK